MADYIAHAQIKLHAFESQILYNYVHSYTKAKFLSLDEAPVIKLVGNFLFPDISSEC